MRETSGRMRMLPPDDDRAAALLETIRSGDLERLGSLLDGDTTLASAWIRDRKGGARSTLHVATDWPGYFPNGPAVVRLLVAAGADPDAAIDGDGETPLHWAASSDDVDVADALLDAGADPERMGGSIAGGTPLDNAVGYGCWHVARRLVERGARVEKPWHAAALGMLARLEELLAASPAPAQVEIDNAFWQACHGGQRRAAELLLARGADLGWVPDYARGHGPGRRRRAGHAPRPARRLAAGAWGPPRQLTSAQLTIATPRAELRELDLDEMRAVLRGEAGAAPPCEDYPAAGTLTGLRIRVDRLERGESPGPWFQIVRRTDGRAVGDFNFHDPPDADGEVVAGMDLAPSARGRGLGTEVLRAACRWALARPDVRSVRGEIALGNAASRRMAEKAGMRFTGMQGDDQQFVMP